MDIGLQELYRRIQLAPAITTFLPEEIGKGEITRISTNNGYQASSWDLVYDREMEVNGMVREGFRLLFCMGEGIEWMSDSRGMQLAAGEACFCMDADVSETMCYEAGCRYLFHSFAFDISAVEHTISAYGVHLRSQIVKLSEQRSPSAEKETVLSAVLSALEAVMMKRHLHRLQAAK